MRDSTTPQAAHEATPGATPIGLFGEVLVDCFPDREVQGGAPFNVAHHLLGLGRGVGIAPVLITRIGKDERGRRLLDAIKTAGLPIDGVQQDCLHPTGRVRITMDANGHHFEIVPDQAWDYIHAEMARLVALSRHPRWIYFGTLAQRAGSRQALRTLLQTTPARMFLDINLRDPWVRKDVLRWSLGQAEVVKVNEEELHRVAHMMGQGSGPARQLGERLIHAFSLRQLLVTQGEKGAWLLKSNGELFQSGTAGTVVDPVDTVGAGDGFAAVFLLGLTQGWPEAQTLTRAHRLAGEICRQRGAIPESDAFYRPFIAEWGLTEEITT
jgi:fructokinase